MKNSENSAYPITVPDGDFKRYGLTKREIFAMAAMQGLAANPNYIDNRAAELCHDAVVLADALLSELEKPTT